MTWFKKKIKFDKNNFEYKAQGRVIKMIYGQLFIDEDQFDKIEYPATYDLAVCLAACIDSYRK